MEEHEYKVLANRLRASYAITLRITRQDLEKKCKKQDITISPLAVAVIRLTAHEPRTIGELSRHMIINPASLVPVVDMLVKKGLITRNTDSKDRRRNPLIATKKGLDIVSKFKAISSSDVLVKNLRKLGLDKTKKLANLTEELLCLMTGNDDICKSILSMAEMNMPKTKVK